MRILLTGFSVLAIAGTAAAETLRVPQDYESIAAAAAVANDGDTIVVSRGIYFENVTFTASSLTIIGKKAIVDGTPGTSHGTAFTISGSGTTVQGFTFRNGSTQLQVNGSNCVVKKCRFDAPRGTALNAAGASSTTVSDCVVVGGASTGIVIGSGSVTRCSVRQGGSDAIVANSSGAVISGCTVLLNTFGEAIDVSGGGATVSGNRVAGSSGGIRIAGDAAIVEKNSITRINLAGITVFGADALVSGNTIVDAEGGIEVFGNSPDILGNRVSGTHDEYYGIYASGDDLAVAGNQVSHGYYYSIGIYVQSASVTGGGFVDDNRVSDIDSGGISVNGTGISVRRNRVAGCGNGYYQSGIFIAGTGHTVEDCSSDANRDTGFRVNGTGHVLRRCRAKNNTAFGFVVFGDGHTVDASTAMGHAGGGIINLSNNLLVTNSTFLGNRQDVSIDPPGSATFDPASTENVFVTGGTDVPSQIWQADD